MSDNNNKIDEQEQQQVALDDDDEENFIDLDHAVEVEEGNGDVPMDEDDGDDDENANENGEGEGDVETNEGKKADVVEDMSIQTISSHMPSSVFTVATYLNKESNTLSIISGGGDDKAFLHKIANDNVLTTMALNHEHTDSVSSIATNESLVTSDLKKTPKYVAVGAYDGTVVLYNPDTGEKIQVLDGPTDVEFIAFHPKGGSVLLAGSISDATVWMYHLPTSKCLQVFVGHESSGDGGGVTSGSFTPDGKFALTIGMDGTMRLWAPRTGMCRHVFKFHNSDGGGMQDQHDARGLTCLAVDGGSDGQLAIAGGEDGSAHVVHLQGKKVVATLRHFDITQGVGSGMAVDDEEEEVMMTSVEAVGFASKDVNSNWVATGGSDGRLKIWDLTFDGGQCRQVCEVKDEQTGGVTRLKWHPNMPVIIASYSDAAVRLWDARNGSLIKTLTGGNSGEDNQINDISVEFFNTENGGGGSAVIVTANDDGNTKVYNVDIGAVIAQNQQM
mmetsp:Transcript_19723/g.24879  ORF Transcript_19723/g.24879 Transcript_19723/m.24879 type:complete len:501 (-) Transcript_19723:103-1605(-)